MSRDYTFKRKLSSAARFLVLRLLGFPTLVNLEVTRRCNARCDFCDYWKTSREAALDDYVPVVRRLKPAVLMLTGGEPLLRGDLERIIRRIAAATPRVFLGLVTNGALLTVRRGLALSEAGLDQLSISLDFLDERHDRARGVPGLAGRILDRAPRLVDEGLRVAFNTVIRSDNVNHIPDILRWADKHGIAVSLSTYTKAKTGNPTPDVTAEQLPQLQGLVHELVKLKAAGAPIASSTYYLQRVPEYFVSGGIPGCRAGLAFVTVTPDGHVRRCAEFPPEGHHAAWKRSSFGPTTCRACWVSCRGETEAPVTLERIRQAALLSRGVESRARRESSYGLSKPSF